MVIEEIAMYEDEPSDKVHDVLATAIFGDHPLGRPVIGRAEVIGSVPVPDIAAYHDARYVPSNIVVAAAGNVEHDRIVELVEGALRRRGRRTPRPSPSPRRPSCAPSLRFHAKDTEQYHLCLGGAGPRARRRPPLRPARARHDPRRLDLVAAVPGGAREARPGLRRLLLREPVRRLRARSGIYVGTRPDNVGEAMDVIGTELRRIAADGVTEEELERARENVKGRTTLSMESTLARMNRLGSSLLMGVPLLTLDEVLAAIDAVTVEDVEALAAELFDPARMSAAGRGRRRGRASARRSSAVNPALLAA